jgi:ubiquinone/menaquinone biosynthesis C-methylase UbiE
MTLQESQAADAFSLQALSFDEIEKHNPVLQYMRAEVRAYMRTIVEPGDRILELNAGTGIDALTFAHWGCHVFATDISEGMLNVLNSKKQKVFYGYKIETRQLSFNNLSSLAGKKFNHVFSNFGGLNCAEKLESVVGQINLLLLSGGYATLVIMPPISPIEIVTILKGNKNAFRRFKKNGIDSKVENRHFKTYYYSANTVKAYFGKKYKRRYLQSLGLLVPPPHADHFVKKHLKLFEAMKSFDRTLGKFPLFRNVGDHFIISLQKI